MIKKLLSLFRNTSLATLGLYFFLCTPIVFGQTADDITRIHTDWNNGYWTANAATGVGNRPDLENNLIGFEWKGKTYSTGVDDAKLTSAVSNVSTQKFRALKIQSLNFSGSTYFLQGSMMDGSSSGRALTPAFVGGPNLKSELASRLTDGKNGLSLGTGIANIDKGDVYFKIGTDNLVLTGLNDDIPDLLVTQVAQPGGADTFKFIDASGKIVGAPIVVDFNSVRRVGSYSLDLFNANNGAIAGGFNPGEVRDIRILGYDISAFGINATNAKDVDRFVVSFSGSSDCAFIAFNAETLKKSELSLIKKGKLMGCGLVGDKINYTFDITNSGQVEIKNVIVTDPLPGIVLSGPQSLAPLKPGETRQVTGTYTITAADVAAGKVINSAKVTGLDISDVVVEDISGETETDDNPTIISLITAPTAITGATTICNGDSTTLTASGGSVVTGAIVEWYTGSCGGTKIGEGNSITVSPTVDTTYFVKYQSSCNTNCASQKVTVNPMLTPSVSISANPSGAICVGTNVTFTASPTNGGTSPKYQWKSGTNNISGATASTYSSSTLANGEVISVVMTSNASCLTTSTGTSNSISMTVNALPAAPVFGSRTQPDCVSSKGSIVLNGLPTSGTVYQTGTSANSYAITNSTQTMTITGLAVGTYNFSVSNGSCTSSMTGNVSINPVVTKRWINGNWSPAGAPTASDIVSFEDHATLTAPLNACSCIIGSEVNVVVGEAGKDNSNAILNVVNGLDVYGTLTFENGASLVQTNNVANTGIITYKRTTTALRQYDYVYWGSPVTGQSLTSMASNTDLYYSWGGANWASEWGAMVPGVGYIIRVNNALTSQTASFIGAPNNGDITYTSPLSSAAYCLMGNPYPSAVSADAFILANFDTSTTSSGGTLYFWTHNTARFQSGNQLVYSSNDYASYNLTGPTRTVKKTAAISDTNGKVPSGQIAAGQSFFTGNNLTGVFKFTNAMRSGNSGDNSQFFRQSTTKKSANIEKNRVWLNLTNDGGAFKQLLVGYVTGATNDYDNLYDGVTYNGNSYVDFYSINNNKSLSIQGRKLPFDPTDEVPLGYKTTIAGTFQIGIDDVDGDLINQSIFIEDKMTNKTHDLKTGDYSFTTEVGTFTDRFVLRYSNTSKLGTGDFEAQGKGVIVSVNNRQIKVNSFDEVISAIKVYDLKGSLIYEKDNVNKNEFIINHLKSGDQFMIVMTQLENGKWISEEIIFHD